MALILKRIDPLNDGPPMLHLSQYRGEIFDLFLDRTYLFPQLRCQTYLLGLSTLKQEADLRLYLEHILIREQFIVEEIENSALERLFLDSFYATTVMATVVPTITIDSRTTLAAHGA
ncbi:MAG: hypothetical protein AAFR75_00375 [Pseudomonadota bacterium]